MVKIDVLIVYENKVRELESICLLKCELEKRGLSVAIINTLNAIYGQTHKYDAKVVVAPSMYNDGIYDFLKSFCGNVPKVVNLQWEQIGPVGDREKEDAWYILKGIAHQCMNICWGENTYNRLITKAGIDEKHLCISGHMAMDFCRPDLRAFYNPKEYIIDRFHLPVDKELNLFISSFSYVNLPERIERESLFSEVDKFKMISVKSFLATIDWFRKYLQTHNNQVIIYRPHPSEASSPVLQKMASEFSGKFFIISDLSVKQWILVADRVYTWYSTSTAEAYALKKPFIVLRPVEMPLECETELLEFIPKTTKYDEFEKTFDSKTGTEFDNNLFNRFYYNNTIPAFIRVANAIETVYNSEDYYIHDIRPGVKLSLGQQIKALAHNFVSLFANLFPASCHFIDKYRDKGHLEVDEYTKHRIEINYASQQEIDNICERINMLLKNK